MGSGLLPDATCPFCGSKVEVSGSVCKNACAAFAACGRCGMRGPEIRAAYQDDDGASRHGWELREAALEVFGMIRFDMVKTCRDFGGEEGTNGEGYDFACSRCGHCCDLPQPNFCPSCGATVEDGGDGDE